MNYILWRYKGKTKEYYAGGDIKHTVMGTTPFSQHATTLIKDEIVEYSAAIHDAGWNKKVKV